MSKPSPTPWTAFTRARRIVPADGQISPIAFPDVVLTVGDFLLE